MSDVGTILDLLSASSDVALVILVYMIWRLDRRVLALELQIKTLFNQLAVALRLNNASKQRE